MELNQDVATNVTVLTLTPQEVKWVSVAVQNTKVGLANAVAQGDNTEEGHLEFLTVLSDQLVPLTEVVEGLAGVDNGPDGVVAAPV